ncbi:VWA-like domain-containing protein [Variovorax sp. LT1P1]|uniref:VWA-like domain-containing protein n=1 Tax=Variovorax sp. LT1P1 TaxID=3443730 RepID=UPI003F44EDFD
MSTSPPSSLTQQVVKQPKKNIFGQSTTIATDRTKVGVRVGSPSDGLAKEVGRIAQGAWYQGDPELARLLESYHRQIAGDRNYPDSRGVGARFGFLGHAARRLPAPVLIDDPDIGQFLFGQSTPTAAVDTSGRQWIWAGFLEQLLQEEARGKTAVVPVLLHETSHTVLNHINRLTNYPAKVANIAEDRVINPMVVTMFPPHTDFSKIISGAYGNTPEDQKYRGLSEETIAKLMLEEARKAQDEKGTIRIKNLVIIDGPVRKITTLSAKKDEVVDFDTVTVVVEDQGLMDKIDHIFDCATLEIDNIDNRLKTRHRKGAKGPGQSEESPIQIPVASDSSGDGSEPSDGEPSAGPDQAASGQGIADDADPRRKSLDDVLNDSGSSTTSQSGSRSAPGDPTSPKDGSAPGDNAPNAADTPSLSGAPDDVVGSLVRGNPLNAPQGHLVDIDALQDWLEKTGRAELVGKMRLKDFAPEQVERVIEVSLAEAEKERLIIGSGYAGGHINDYMNTVVRPNSSYKIFWERRIREFLQGEGTNVAKSLDEYGIYTYVDPTDIGMPADEGVYYEGSVQEKPEERFLILLDTSGSVWADMKRLGHFVAFAVGVRATADETSPDVDIVGADTVVTGTPNFIDDETLLDAVINGINLGGGGGTDFATPLNQILAWAKDNDIVYQGIIYVTDFECRAPERSELPEDMPPLVWAGMPHDHVKAQHFIDAVSSYSEVVVMEDGKVYDFAAAQDKADATGHLGHTRLSS